MARPKPKIFVLDDSATIRGYFERIGASVDVDLVTFESAAASEDYLASVAPDLMFLDIILPDKDGLTFLQELRKDARHRNTSVVMISSKDYAQDRTTAKELGVVAFLPKPITTQTIEDLIRQYAGHGHPAPEQDG